MQSEMKTVCLDVAGDCVPSRDRVRAMWPTWACRDARGGGLLDVSLALALTIPAGAVLAALYVVHLLFTRAEGPFLYRGRRLGLHRKPFTIFKVRTLRADAEQRLGARLCTREDELHTPYGDFLRRTRLDELPQIFNILRGDMVFVGPRPEREAVYRERAAKIPGYERRFDVPPGLTGIAQFFTPHGTPKGIRARIDNQFVRSGGNAWHRMRLITLTGVRLAWLALKEPSLAAIAWVAGRLGHRALDIRARAARRRIRQSRCEIVGPRNERMPAQVMHVDRGRVSLYTPRRLDAHEAIDFEIVQPARRPDGRWKHTRIRCRGTAHPTAGADAGVYTIAYEPRTDFSHYRLERYILGMAFG